MKCRQCEQDGFANVGEVARHKATECPARLPRDEDEMGLEAAAQAVKATTQPREDVLDMDDVAVQTVIPAGSIIAATRLLEQREHKPGIIPWHQLPPEARVLSRKSPVRFSQVVGTLTDEGLVVESIKR